MGLSAAFEASRVEGVEAALYERDSRPGGLARTFELAGRKWERYHHFISADDEFLLEATRELGLSDEISWRDTRMAYFVGGELVPFVSASDLLKFPGLSVGEKLRFGWSMTRLAGRNNWRSLEKIPARDWLIEKQGAHAYGILWSHLMELKFGSEIARVPLSWLWARGKRRASNRNFFGGSERFGVFTKSADSLAFAMADGIRENGGSVRFSTAVEKLKKKGSGKIAVHAGEGSEDYDAVIVTAPLPDFISLVDGFPKVYRTALASIKYAAIVNMVVALDEPLSDYFWLNVSDRDMPFPGIIEMTRLRPDPDGASLVYIPNYMDSDSADFELKDGQWFERYLPALQRIKPGLRKKHIKEYRVFRDRYADPYYTLNYSRAAPRIETPIEDLYLANTAQVYPATRSLNNSIGWGAGAARIALKRAGGAAGK